ncbi:MAG: DUF4142 domain-containing protein, partial [Alphaproteobacteria bacterium]|nr:DUF4142 domain-containing protein [Alphaproteobacteria bacterium]
MRYLLLLSAFALPACVGAGTNMPAAPGTMAAADFEVPSSPSEYVAMAGASDLYEIESSRLALQRSTDAQVQQFARRMIDHHTETTNAVMEAARSAGLNPPAPQLMPMQREMMDTLRSRDAASFDGAYLSQQRRAHQMALALHSGFAERGQ